jgi:beta-N-acetylhexosaminidase
MLGPVVLDIEGLSLTERERRRLHHPLVGQVILFSRNFESLPQLAQLTREIHSLRDPPLLICVDHEGGRVQRFRTGLTSIEPMSHLGEHWDRDVLGSCRQAYSTGFVIATELRSLGIDLSFAPVLDLAWGRSEVIGDRALHADPRVVTMLASHLIHGLAQGGMASCGKHFPGHGWTAADSHHDVPVDSRPLEQILGKDAAPYRWLAVSLASVMPAHVVFTQADAQPAGFSARWIERILRGQLGFCGAVYSDDLSMGGARVAGDMVARAGAALAAGCDFILICNDPDAADLVLEQLSWKRTEMFEQRLARVQPRGPAPAGLERNATYQAALRDVVQRSRRT